MIYILIALTICIIVIALKYKGKSTNADRGVTNLVQCAICGIYVERSECKNRNGKYFCADCK